MSGETARPARPPRTYLSGLRPLGLKRCAELGATDLTEQALYNIEGGQPDKEGKRRRNVTLEELLLLAAALDVMPVHLMVGFDDDRPYRVTAEHTEPSGRVRDWIRGSVPLSITDRRLFYSEVPADEWDLFAGASGDEATAQAMSRKQLADRFRATADHLEGRDDG